MRADKKKNINKVAKVVLKEPLLTERQVAQKTGLSNGTAHNVIKELEQTGAKDPTIIRITDRDLQNIEEMQAVLSQKIKNPEEMKGTRIGELAQAMREATARYSLFRGSATDEKGGLKKGLSDMSDTELIRILNENQ